MSDHQIKQVYTEAELSKVLNLSRETLRKLRSTGKLGYARVPGGIRYTQKHLDDYLIANDMSASKRTMKKAS